MVSKKGVKVVGKNKICLCLNYNNSYLNKFFSNQVYSNQIFLHHSYTYNGLYNNNWRGLALQLSTYSELNRIRE